MSQLPRLLVVVGPTASGKSSLAAELALQLGGEIVSADSVQVYRYFDIGSGKPSADDRKKAPHHLIDCANPNEPLEASVWAEMARKTISEIHARGRWPIVCGGTFLWVRALLYGLVEAPAADLEVRARHQEIARVSGRGVLHDMLSQVDPESALRLHPNDTVRVSRALEVFELSGQKLSDLQEAHGFRKPLYDATLMRIDWPTEQYEERLARRVWAMLDSGWKEEVRRLLQMGFEDTRAMDSVGYRQVRAALGAKDPPTDEQLVDDVVRVTRIFARRQRTWLRDEKILSVSPRCLSDPAELHSLMEALPSAPGDA